MLYFLSDKISYELVKIVKSRNNCQVLPKSEEENIMDKDNIYVETLILAQRRLVDSYSCTC